MTDTIDSKIADLMADGKPRTLGDILRSLGPMQPVRKRRFESELKRLSIAGDLQRSESNHIAIYQRAAQ